MAIMPIDSDALDAALWQRLDSKTKPPGSLGELEQLAWRLGRIQNTLTPRVDRPAILVFAADHGIAERGVSAYPQDVTAQMVRNFAQGGAAINVLTRLHGVELEVVDAGVIGDLSDLSSVVQAKIAAGTKDFSTQSAMSEEQLADALEFGASRGAAHATRGTSVLGFGEMGIGNTSSASMLLSLLADLPIARCVGPGTGLDDEGVARKLDVLTQARARIQPVLCKPLDARQVLRECGGFEIAMIAGAMLAAAERRTAVVVDGFIASAACLFACTLNPALRDYCIFAHHSKEPAHTLLLQQLQARPLLNLDLRLGEGTGAALAIPLLRAAAAILDEMASFDAAGVSGPVQ